MEEGRHLASGHWLVGAETVVADAQGDAGLAHPLHGRCVGFKAGRFANAYFSRIKVTLQDNPQMTAEMPTLTPAPSNTLMSYQVSGYFDEENLKDKTRLTDADKQVTWQKMECEADGIANLSRIQNHREKNTAFVRVDINSESKQIKELRFGYSDRVRVYVNNRLIYSGNNGYQSRDFRYLGTMGLFDSVYLPLRKGHNEVWFAVSETFGGWGIISQLADTDGITVEGDIQSMASKAQ